MENNENYLNFIFLRLYTTPFSYPEPFLRAVNGARQGALAKSISNWHLIGYNEGYCSNNVYILLPCFYGIRFWIWPEPLVAPCVRRALGTRMIQHEIYRHPRPQAKARAALTVALVLTCDQASLVQAVDLRRNSDAEAWSHSICISP